MACSPVPKVGETAAPSAPPVPTPMGGGTLARAKGPMAQRGPRYGGDRRNRRSISLNNFIALENGLLSQLKLN